MSEIEHLIVSLPTEMATAVKGAVEAGDYPSSSDVVQAALQDWVLKRAARASAALKADIESGLADVAAGRVQDFDVARIVERGRRLSADRSSST